MSDAPAATKASTPLAQLRAQAAAAKQNDQPPAPAPAPAPPPPEDAIPELSALSANPPPAHPIPTQTPPAPAPPPETAPPAEPKKAPAEPSGGYLSFVSLKQLKICAAVALIFIVVTMMPVEAIVSRVQFIKNMPLANSLIKALTAGIAVAALSPPC